ncbi:MULTISPECIES: DNA polymerase III subunit alpha [unclassified Streptococcus]|uniref:DNA polymerase III subunit alpha n=1 Tax=unclassified Streptococcus TaxID=2608887 RepID=UPI001072BCC4|nr:MULTISPECIES: DNA polymerase III subunit alpha [unclassified Streptococcus]MBF0786461.1 DNA polymerase III subunit alpha [Streptococcus sp. 19428wC2_LYSM12]MCQ9212423.1 DNA polymerase III subunit alpha [Streptococcus sp. B01]MCQ9213761.1 DNA polymerase III subunit alpha [Streptococcus sp. O1]TFV06709.1 DNA polymerase III subunit alpha [Streptococcus sp. LYSM12]
MLAQLDTKTVYTFMDSMMTIDRYVAGAKEMGYTHLGIMDRDNLYAAYSFMEACEKVGIQPVIGCEMEFLISSEESLMIQLVAKNTAGYQNLLKISTAKMTGQREFEAIRPYLTGIAVIIPYFDGIEDYDVGIDFYIGVCETTPALRTSRPLIPLHTVRYFEESQVEVLQVLQAIQENIPLNQVSSIVHNQALLSPESLAAIFRQRFPEAIEELNRLVSGIFYELDKNLKLPRFNRKRVAVEELREKAQEGLQSRGLADPVYQERLDQELAIIHQMGFDDYFLIVWDLLRFGRSQGYYMGMGRGSAVGSLVAYVLYITGIDPVKHDLLFERFLNIERYSMPDIDIDIPDIHRGDFIRYVRERYGTFHAAQIVTYSTFGAKQALRDVLKRYGASEYEVSALTKKISFRDTLATAYERNASFRQVINSKIEYQKAYAIAQQIEGQPRQTSIHAAGVVMSDEELTDTIPLKAGEDMLVTQYDAHAVEANGLLKMDFLGLRNLTFVQKMAAAVEEKYGKKIVISEIDLEDKATLELFAKGQTKGIFQFEQPGAIHLLKRVQPSRFEEVVATTSLNRPGASDYSDNFVKRKHGQEAVDLLDDSIAAILRPTYGIMLYQEQVMQIAQRFAGFTLGKADLLRRAMSKKNKEEMQSMEADFLVGALQNGHDEDKARVIFSMMAKFAGYGFNRSHAYAYSALAFQLAYFKTHYPDVFFDIMLNYSSSDYISDALQFDFQVAPVTINSIPYHDKFDEKKIYMGLKNIKGLPRELSFWMIEERPFKSVEDFILRLPPQFKKREILKPLIQLGLFDIFESNRKKILENLDNLFVFADTFGTFFSEESYSWLEADDYSDSEKFSLEQAIIGIGISPHPLVLLAKSASKPHTPFSELVVGSAVTILGQIQSVRIIRTKRTGQQMAFIQVTDTKKKLDVTLFPDIYQRYQTFLKEGEIFYLTGRTQEREGQLQLVLDRLEQPSTEKFWILLENRDNDQQIAKILADYPGTIPVILHYQDSNQTVQLERIFIERSPHLQSRLQKFSMKTVFR